MAPIRSTIRLCMVALCCLLATHEAAATGEEPTGPKAAISIEKRAGEVSDTGDGSFRVPFTITVSNVGEETLVALQIEDVLDLFHHGRWLGVEDLDSPDLTLNPNYDGINDYEVLSGADRLDPGQSATVSFTLHFDPTGEEETLRNKAVATATGEESGTELRESGKAFFEPKPTEPPPPPPLPGIEVTKQAGEVTVSDDGSQIVPFTITVTNTGEETLASLQLRDSLDIFRTGQLLVIENISAVGITLNSNYDGLSEIDLLAGTDRLEVGNSASVSFTVRFEPGDEEESFINAVEATAAGKVSGTPVNDSAQASFDPQPVEPPPPPPPVPGINVSIIAGGLVLGEGNQVVPFTITVTNTGEEPLTSLQLEDSLDIFREGELIGIGNLDAPGLTLNPGYDGITDINILSGTDTVPVDGEVVVTFDVLFDPGDETDPFTNTVTGTATGEISGEEVSDSAQVSFEPLPVEPPPPPPPVPGIDVTKQAGQVAMDGDDQVVPFTITVTNTGGEVLTALRLEDSLDIFRTGSLLAIEDLDSADLTINPDYDGLADIELLGGNDQLAEGTSATLTFTVRFDPADETEPFINEVTGTAIGEVSGDEVNGSAQVSFEPLPVEPPPPPPPPPMPGIAVSNEAGDVVLGDGYQSVSFTITVTNTGEESLTYLQLEDSLDIFRTGQLLEIENLDSVDLTINANYDGLTNIELLEGNDQLATGASAALTLTVRFDPAEETEPFTNEVTGTAIGETSLEEVTDTAEVSFEPLAAEPPPPPPILPADISVTKRADKSEVVRGEAVGYEVLITNLSDQVISGVSISDMPPHGFDFVRESALLVRTGPDDVLDTHDDVRVALDSTGSRPITFEDFDLAPSEAVVVRYQMKVKVGVADGEYENEVTVVSDGRSAVTSGVSIPVVGDPMFEKTTLIGKVYDDRNGNLVQDPDEFGVPGVRLATVGGLLVETDSAGRFHIAAIDVPRFERGINFILKVDESTLPDRTSMLSANPRVVRLTQATMSKVNFAVQLPYSDSEACYRQCYEVTPQHSTTTVGVVRFPSGRAEMPIGFASQLQSLLGEYEDRQHAQLVFVGRAAAGDRDDSEPRARALEVCRYTRDFLNVPTDCSRIETRGSAGLVAGTASVEVEIEYFEIEPLASTVPVEPEQCLRTNVETGFLDVVLSERPRFLETREICETSPPRGPRVSTATARKITISGGEFGCDYMAAEVLPGRDAGDAGLERSIVTVFATHDERRKRKEAGELCKDTWRANIRAGGYPIEIRTERNSVLWVNSAGDVLRGNDPENDERIVVTPFRDETDVATITALRIANEGSEPVRRDSTAAREDGEGDRHYRTSASLIIDPRLDVLAMEPAYRYPMGEQRTLRFAAYTNYREFTDEYSLDVYGLRRGGYSRELLDSIPSDDIGFGNTFDFAYAADMLAPYAELEYVLKATNCEGEGEARRCVSDETVPRIMVIHNEDPGQGARRDPKELWGKTNLAQQRIRIDGGRVRTTGIADEDDKILIVDGRPVPVGRNLRYVLEEHLPFAAESGSATEPEAPGALPPAQVSISADATGITVSGGAFGCKQLIDQPLLGRQSKHDRIPMSMTVIADPGNAVPPGTVCEDGGVAGGYPVVITTAEDSVLHITKAGDVLRERYPHDDNNQQIVVTPFRDYTDNTLISALRIANEGVALPREPERAPEPIGPTPSGDSESDRFLVAMANLTIGQNNVSGSDALLDADPHFDGSTFTDGRLAFYGKARFRDKYLVTAQLDTTEDELRNLSDNLESKDPRRVFRQLDPNRYYALYGDDSTTTTDVDTQGAFYLRVDWNDNTALWGNYNTGLTDTEFMHYNRSLYGAKLRHASQGTTEFGDSRTEFTVFASEPQSAAAHITFRATGGSLYFLRDTDIVEGSEKVWIEVRRRGTEQVVEREVLFEGRDYEIDDLQGRIILARPLAQIVAERATSIIRSTPVEGDEVFLLVDYEYVPARFNADNLTVGARGRAWLTDFFGVGATAINDDRDGTDYEMRGVDLTFKKSERTYVRAEYADSRARQSDPNLVSYDGGLSFQPRLGAGVDGDAYAIEARLDLKDFSETMTGDIRAWHKTRDAGFSTGRLGQDVDVDDTGIEAHIQFGEGLDVTASFTELERSLVARERVARFQADGVFGRLSGGLELRYEDMDQLQAMPLLPPPSLGGPDVDGSSLLLGARVGYELDDQSTIYATAQTAPGDTNSEEKNTLFTMGMNRRMSDKVALSVEASDGDRGSAVSAGLDYTTAAGVDFNIAGGVGDGAVTQFGTRYAVADGHELYGTYTVDPGRTEAARNLLTLGQRRAFGNSLSLFTESTFGKDEQFAGAAHTFGLGFEGIEDWRFTASMQLGENDREGVTFDRRALSLGALLRREGLQLSSRIEWREDKGVLAQERQFLSSNSFTKVVDPDRRWIGQLNFSWTDDEINGGRDARFVELEIGHAYRPATSDRLNLIAKYSFLYDLPTEGQDTSRPDEQSHLLALDGIYDLSDRWELGAKLAVRKGKRRLMRDDGTWFDFGLRMAALRARLQVTRKWDGLAEYRWLSDFEGDGDRHGALLAAYRHIGEHMQVGVGFNFTDFNDELTSEDYRSNGWFIDIVGKY